MRIQIVSGGEEFATVVALGTRGGLFVAAAAEAHVQLPDVLAQVTLVPYTHTAMVAVVALAVHALLHQVAISTVPGVVHPAALAALPG